MSALLLRLMLVSAWLSASAVHAQSVALQGMLGNKALLIVDGAAPKSVAPGEMHQGVRVIATSGDQAVLEFGGKRHTLRVGDAPSGVAGGAAGSRGNKVVLSAGSNGHFLSTGSINGGAVQFMVDTGASVVALSAGQADRVGVKWQGGRPVQMSTANGVTTAFLVKLDSVRVGDVEVYQVDAVVLPASMPYVLLGNSFLSRFQMKRDNDQMVLERRY